MVKKIKRYKYIYILIIPTIIYFIIFAYVPFYGLQIAFKKFQIFKGIGGSPWVGMQHFAYVFSSERFFLVLKNTIIINIYHLAFGFPIPVIFALMLNEVKNIYFKKTIQTITYFPHFLSWVVFAGMIYSFFGPNGLINSYLRTNSQDTVSFLSNPRYFRSVLVITAILKEFGWSAIIYLAALSGIDPELYNAAKVDGAKKMRQIWHITLPGIRSTIILLLVLSVGNLMSAGFDQVFMLYNSAVLEVGDILDTYLYRIGLQQSQYEVATAVGLFKGVVGMILILGTNQLAKRLEGRSLW